MTAKAEAATAATVADKGEGSPGAVTTDSPKSAGNMSVAQLASMLNRPKAAVAKAANEKSVERRSVERESAATAEADTTETQTASADGTGDLEQSPEAGAQAEGTELPAEAGRLEEGTEGTEGTEGESAEEVPKSVRQLQARVNKLTARAKAAEEALAKLRAPGAGGSPVSPHPSPLPRGEGERSQVPAGAERGASERGSVGAHPELARLDEELNGFRAAIRFAEENADGGEYTDGRGNKRFFDAAAIRTIRRNAEEGRQMAIAERTTVAHQLRTAAAQERARYESEAQRVYPWLADPESPESMEVRQVFEQAPELRRFPDATQWVADAIAGKKARVEGAAKAVVKPGTPMRKPIGGSREPAPVVTRPIAGTPKVNPAQKAVQEAEASFQKSGKMRDYQRVLSAKRAALQP